MPFRVESVTHALLIVGLFMATLAPALGSVLSPQIASQFNQSAYQTTGALQNYVFKQVNNTAFCGTSASCTNSSGGFFAANNANAATIFGFVLNGFGTLMTALVQTPFIMASLIGTTLQVTGTPIVTNTLIQNDLAAFVDFCFVVIGISAYMKFPILSGG